MTLLRRSALRPPILVAESLRDGEHLLTGTVLPPGEAAPDRVAAAIAQVLRPASRPDAVPPSWLRPNQVWPFRRALGALDRHGGAMLALPTGSGKTWMALAVARTLSPGPVGVVAPAVLLPQWRGVAARCGVPVVAQSMEAFSRGPKPLPSHPLVIVAEAHRLRNPGTHRYRRLAGALIGRQVLFLTATPVVNRLDDLGQVLRLGIPTDSLAPAGLPTLLLSPHPRPMVVDALGEVVITGPPPTAPPAVHHTVTWSLTPGIRTIMEGVSGLACTGDEAGRALLRHAFWTALASSPAALRMALARYRSLLLHAADAARAGRGVTRRELHRLLGQEPEQLLLWELLGDDGPMALPLEDLHRLAPLLEAVGAECTEPDDKLIRLRPFLADGPATIVFTTRTATVTWLQRHLDRRIHWCTGSAAGVDTLRCDRGVVLQRFRPGGGAESGDVLVTTDVSAEGLDLHGAGRVVHYDLPWSPLRMAQRTGRVRRHGSLHSNVEIIAFHPPPEIERHLGQLAILDRKRALPPLLGLGENEDTPWRWRDTLAQYWRDRPWQSGIAWIPDAPDGLLVGLRVLVRGRTIGGRCWWWSEGQWTEGVRAVSDALTRADRSAGSFPSPALMRTVAHLVAEPVARAAREMHARHWPLARDGVRGVLLSRLFRLGQQAARARDHRMVAAIGSAVSFVRRGHTAGEEPWLTELLALPASRLPAWTATLPEREVVITPRVEVVGVVAFGGLELDPRTSGGKRPDLPVPFPSPTVWERGQG